MSDNTATAREPSMEDILASIRRIIDEEDTRDGRPSSDSFGEDSVADEIDTSMPVMAPAAANRESDTSMTLTEVALDDDDASDGEEAIFPERESLFWSRATGRGGSASDASDESDADEASGGMGGAAIAGAAAAATAGAAAVGGTATDIFTRAQNKLGSTGRTGSTRERMQNLAARSANRMEETADDVLDPVEDLADLNAVDELADIADDTLPDFSSVDDEDAADVLELTDPVDTLDSEAKAGMDTLIARADAELGGNVEDKAEAIAQVETDDPVAQAYENAFESTASTQAAEDDSVEANVAAADDEAAAQDDVFDLTVALGEESKSDDATVEDGDDDPVDVRAEETDDVVTAEVEQEAAPETSEDGLPEIGPGERLEDDYSARFYGDTASVEDDIAEAVASDEGSSEAFGHDDADTVADAAADTEQDDGDDGDDAYAGSLMTGDTYSVSDAETAEDADEAGDEDDAGDGPGWGAGLGAAAMTAGVAAGSASGFYATEDDDKDDSPETDEPLGFSDTFSASDVYHDDPPALDDDYSASLDRADEPVMARSGFAGEDAFGEEPPLSTHPDDEMDKVGGLVRDAMERDPVDYADPSTLVSMSSEEISARALASLADVEGEASRRMYGALRIGEDSESESIEGMVKGMLRPMLREWLDDNLPNIVETMVRGEVERISAKSRKYSRASDED